MKRTTGHWLLVFVKAPTPGAVKTRLLPLLSAAEAAQLYRGLVVDTLKVAKRLRNIHVVVAYAADRTFPDLAWLDAKPPMLFQHGRTLGERLSQAFEWAFEQGARHVVALGSDAPDLSTRWVGQSFQALTRCDVVVGPTTDGGYQLIGLTRPHPELFVDMPWSSPRLFGQTLDRIGRLNLSVRCLDLVADLDTPEDVHRYLAQRSRGRGQTRRYLRNTLRKRWTPKGPRREASEPATTSGGCRE